MPLLNKNDFSFSPWLPGLRALNGHESPSHSLRAKIKTLTFVEGVQVTQRYFKALSSVLNSACSLNNHVGYDLMEEETGSE